MSQKTILTEVIEELEKAITVAKRMEHSGNQPTIEVAILLGKLQLCYEKVLFSQGKAQPIYPEKVETIHTTIATEANKKNLSEEPLIAKRTQAPEPKQSSNGSMDEPIITISDTRKNPVVEPNKPQIAKEEEHKHTRKTEILGDKLLSGKRFLSDFMAENKDRQDVTSKMQAKPIKDLSKAFGINDKFQYTRELFNNDNTHFQNTIITINQMGSIEEALIHIGAHFDWQADDPIVIQFIDILQRRFM